MERGPNFWYNGIVDKVTGREIVEGDGRSEGDGPKKNESRRELMGKKKREETVCGRA